MFVLGSFKESPDEVLMEIIRITCEAQNDKEPKAGFSAPSAYAGFEITKYLWKIGAIKVIPDEKMKQMTLKDMMSKGQ